jgi:hypothetical protein
MSLDACNVIPGVGSPAIATGTTIQLIASVPVQRPHAVVADPALRDVWLVEARRFEANRVSTGTAALMVLSVAIVDEVVPRTPEHRVSSTVRADAFEVVVPSVARDTVEARSTDCDVASSSSVDAIAIATSVGVVLAAAPG